MDRMHVELGMHMWNQQSTYWINPVHWQAKEIIFRSNQEYTFGIDWLQIVDFFSHSAETINIKKYKQNGRLRRFGSALRLFQVTNAPPEPL